MDEQICNNKTSNILPYSLNNIKPILRLKAIDSEPNTKDTDSNSEDTDSASSDDTVIEDKSEIKKDFPLNPVANDNEFLTRMMQVMSLSCEVLNILTCIKIVIDENPEYDLNNHRGYWCAPLHYAAIMRLEDVALYLIEKGANVNKLDMYGNNPLNYAVGMFDYKSISGIVRQNKEMPKLVNKLIEMQVNVGNINGVSELYPVHEAIKNQYYNSHYLIRLRMYYVLNTDIPLIKETDEYKNLIKLKNEEKSEPEIGIDKLITIIVKRDEKRAIQYLEKDLTLAHGIDLHGQSMLHYAVHRNMRKLIKKLIELDINYNRKNVHNLTAFGMCDIMEKEGKNGNNIKKFLTETIINHKKNKLIAPRSPMSHDELNLMLLEEEENQKKEDSKNTEKNRKKKEKAKQKKEEIRRKQIESNNKKVKQIEEQKERDRILREEKIEKERLENERIEKEKYENLLKAQEIKRNKKFEKIKKLKEKKCLKKQKETELKMENDNKMKTWKNDLYKYSPTDDEKELYDRACNLIELYEQNDGMDILPSGKRVPIVFM